MKYLAQALLEILAWFMLPFAIIQESYLIAKNNLQMYLKNNSIKDLR